MLILFKGSNVKVRISSTAVNFLHGKIQQKGKPETGGMLFTRSLVDSVIQIDLITGECPGDRSSQNSFLPSEAEWQERIKELYGEGYHYIGDWHTHFQVKPSPSFKDKKTIKAVFNESKHDLKYMVLLILGTEPSMKDLYVGLTDGRKLYSRSN